MLFTVDMDHILMIYILTYGVLHPFYVFFIVKPSAGLAVSLSCLKCLEVLWVCGPRTEDQRGDTHR